jgi:transposase
VTATATSAGSTETKGADNAKKEIRGEVLDVLKELLSGRRDEEVIALVAKLVARNGELELLLAKLRERRNKGEHIAPGQLDMFLKELEKKTPAGSLADANKKLEEAAKNNGGRPEKPKPPKQPAVRRPLPPELRRVDNPILVPESERPCPRCGGERKCVCFETTPVLELIPAEVIVRLDKREILACGTCDAEMQRAPMGDKVVTGGVYGSRLVATLVVDKYKFGLPLYRQGERFEALGLLIPSSSMSDQIMWATDLLRPIWRGLIDDVRSAHVMHGDATSLPVRDKDSPKGIILGSLWGYVGDQTHAVYLYTSTGKRYGQRAGEIGPVQMLQMRADLGKQFVVVDASSIFDKSFLTTELIEVGCNMHARRYFIKAKDAEDVRAAVPLAAFKALYDVEACVHDASPEEKLAERQRRSKPVYDELVAWCLTYQPHEPPASMLGKAIQYLLNHRVALTRFLEDGTLPIDNGIVERLHRIPALTRMNFLFAGSHAGAERAAIAYSIIGSCELLGIDPVEYMADVLPRIARNDIVLARDIPALLPAAWKKARAAAESTGPPPQ